MSCSEIVKDREERLSSCSGSAWPASTAVYGCLRELLSLSFECVVLSVGAAGMVAIVSGDFHSLNVNHPT